MRGELSPPHQLCRPGAAEPDLRRGKPRRMAEHRLHPGAAGADDRNAGSRTSARALATSPSSSRARSPRASSTLSTPNRTLQAHMRERFSAPRFAQVRVGACLPADPCLPEGLDLVFLANVYRFIEDRPGFPRPARRAGHRQSPHRVRRFQGMRAAGSGRSRPRPKSGRQALLSGSSISWAVRTTTS